MNQETVECECPICGKVYTARVGRLKFGRETTCSRACSYRLRADGLEQQVSLTCAVCGREFSRPPSHVKGKYTGQFCSSACHYAGRATGATRRVVKKPYTITDAGRAAWLIGAQKTVIKRRAGDNYIKSDATRAKLSVATARAIAKGNVFTSSKLEDKVAAQLDALGVAYTRQRAFRDDRGRFAFVVDFWLTTSGVALEVNGTYWHADPRVYTGALNTTQQRCVRQYRRKLEVLESVGIRVVEVWELDTKQDIAQAVAVAYAQATTG